MQRWQRRAHLWLWLLLAIAVTTVLWALIKDQPQLSLAPADIQRP